MGVVLITAPKSHFMPRHTLYTNWTLAYLLKTNFKTLSNQRPLFQTRYPVITCLQLGQSPCVPK